MISRLWIVSEDENAGPDGGCIARRVHREVTSEGYGRAHLTGEQFTAGSLAETRSRLARMPCERMTSPGGLARLRREFPGTIEVWW